MIPSAPYGNSGITLPVLGFGAGLIGDGAMDENYVGSFLNQIVDRGITFIDTARGYGLSEERIGRHLSWRRNDFILSTKVGYSIPGTQDWTYDCIIHGVNTALHVMRTDHIDIVHLHSCPADVLQRGDVIEALLRTVQEGKVRVAAYSGENDALQTALDGRRFGGLMSSINPFDQKALRNILPAARVQGLGYIAKRPVGNAPWRFAERPHGHYCEEYWTRMKTMELDFGNEWQEIALRFSAFAPGVATAIVGTTNLHHIDENIRAVERGPLPSDVTQRIMDAFTPFAHQWNGEA